MAPVDGASVMLWGGFDTTVSTAVYGQFGTFNWNATEANVVTTSPRNCTVSNLYVFMTGANGGGVTTTVTLDINGSPSALTGTVTSGSGSGAVLVSGATTANLLAGQTFDVKAVSSGGTSAVIGGWSAQCQ
jgi:hypothetical protein